MTANVFTFLMAKLSLWWSPKDFEFDLQWCCIVTINSFFDLKLPFQIIVFGFLWNILEDGRWVVLVEDDWLIGRLYERQNYSDAFPDFFDPTPWKLKTSSEIFFGIEKFPVQTLENTAVQ